MDPFTKAINKLRSDCKIIDNPSFEELREFAKHDETTTEYGSPSYVTKIRSRSAKFTEIVEDEPTAKQLKAIYDIGEYLKGKELICLDRTMCKEEHHKIGCRIYVPKEYSKIAYLWGKMLFDPIKGKKPDITVVSVPDWKERYVIVDPKSHTTFIFGSDYAGEVKKANLRLAMYIIKEKEDGLGLHAGSKLLRVITKGGKLEEKGVVMFGLSATGKTTLTCHHHWLDQDKGEGVVIRQNDVVLMFPGSACIGTEDNFYIKTKGLEPKEQPLLYKVAVSKEAALENVKVHKDGKVDFNDCELTENGRAVVIRDEIDLTDDSIDLKKLNMMIFITRRNIIPPIAKLNPAQAAAFFMLGESVESSAGDPTHSGEIKRVVGTNPFIIGPKDEEGNRLFGILKKNPHIECFLMNTGYFGKEKIKIKDSSSFIVGIARETIKWKKDPYWEYEIPEKVDGVDMSRFEPSKHFSKKNYEKLNYSLYDERRRWLGKFDKLDEKILDSIIYLKKLRDLKPK